MQLKRPRPDMDDAEYNRLTIERLKSHVKIDANGCWIWQGFSAWNGYGGTSYRGKGWRVHRLSYFLHKGKIPDGHDVCHTCDVRLCCNPQHLWTGPRLENNRDTRKKGRDNNSQKTHCPHGHPYDATNVYFRPDLGYKGFRGCKTCARIRHRMTKLGWTREQAESLPPTPKGMRPVNRNRTAIV